MIAGLIPSMTARLCLVFIVVLMVSSSVAAHELRPTVADIMATPDSVEVSMRVNLEALIAEIGSEHSDSDDAPQAERYDRLRRMPPDTLLEEFQNYLPQFLAQTTLSDDSATALPLTVKSLSIPQIADIRLPRDSLLVLESLREPAPVSVAWQWDATYGAIIVRADATAPVGSQPAGAGFSQYVPAGDSSAQIAIAPGSLQTSGSTFVDYMVIGYQHIIPKGLDHILFVIGLFLLAPRFGPIAWQVSMFTVAHTVTLALGMTGLIVLPASIVEPLIALSITVVCVENLFGDRFGKGRLAIVFAFGLLHGLGFAGVLSDIGLQPDRFVSSLIAFNIGVELGQLSVVLLCFTLVGWWFGKKPWYRKLITVPASVIIAGIGLFWFLQRLGLMT